VIPRLKQKYNDEIAAKLKEELSSDNAMLVPRLDKIVVNVGVGEAVADKKAVDSVMEELAIITGQKPKLNRAKKSIANFKVRQGMPVGASVTLRGKRMWDDFRGLNPKSFDGRGNYSFGVTEQLIFPEIDYDKVSTVRGMDITICTTADNDEDARALLNAFGFPFRTQQAQA
jgi:large subunit ribosomal protein L5